jgi:hypothetical protein
MNTDHIKKAIQTLEYYHNGLHHISGAGVKVTNLKVRKIKPTTADITLYFDEGERTEKYRGIEYDLQALGTPRKPHGNC